MSRVKRGSRDSSSGVSSDSDDDREAYAKPKHVEEQTHLRKPLNNRYDAVINSGCYDIDKNFQELNVKLFYLSSLFIRDKIASC
ncbi:hypothetical protein DPMN_071858 [Dreissena polymorpha]|uniref:Uncharacterized protein n=1 Tax=Dreissena polymorpha TaxID=45954 RepID=A0A9D3Z5B6_DREPO|nr:hypothetical protein DPMN_071858 [Dreissena polymorpha]